MARRKKIQEDIENDVLYKADRKCCMCNAKGDHIHHIDEDPANNEFDNLVFLCFRHHDEASIKGGLSKKLTPSLIKKYRNSWYRTVSMERARMDSHSPILIEEKQLIQEACSGAEYAYNHLFEVHRGAILWDINITAVFANDGFEPEAGMKYSDANMRSKNELITFRKKLNVQNFRELAFGTSVNKYTWALLVETNDAKQMNDTIWDCYPSGGSNNGAQKDLAFLKLWSYWDNPLKPL